MSEQFAEQADVVADNDTTALDVEPSLVLDEDRMGADPLEDGMDTAEDYSRTVKLGGSQDAEDNDTLAYRIPQEEPDPAAEALDPGRPIADTPIGELDESVDAPEHSIDGVGVPDGMTVVDPLSADGATEGEFGGVDGEIELGLDAADGSAEATGLPADDGIGTAVPVENEWPTEGAEQQALHVEQES